MKIVGFATDSSLSPSDELQCSVVKDITQREAEEELE